MEQIYGGVLGGVLGGVAPGPPPTVFGGHVHVDEPLSGVRAMRSDSAERGLLGWGSTEPFVSVAGPPELAQSFAPWGVFSGSGSATENFMGLLFRGMERVYLRGRLLWQGHQRIFKKCATVCCSFLHLFATLDPAIENKYWKPGSSSDQQFLSSDVPSDVYGTRVVE